MTTFTAAIRLDEYSTGWCLSNEKIHPKGHGAYSNLMRLNILVEPNGQRVEYVGDEAECEYAQLSRNCDERGYFYFTNILTLLREQFENNGKEDQILIKDVAGKCLPALTLFAMTIKFLTDDLKCKGIRTDLLGKDFEKDTFFVIIVPAILQDRREMNFISKAASKAGIDGNKVSVVTDIVAVSFFSQFSSYPWSANENKYLFVRIDDSSNTMRIDTKQNVGLQDVPSVSSFQGGIRLFEEAADNFMVEIFREDIFEMFKAREPSDYFDLKREFGIKMKSVSIGDKYFTLKPPVTLLELYNEITGENIYNLPPKKDCRFIGDKFRVPNSRFVGFFEELKTEVLSHIKKEIETEPIDSIVMFGKLAESPIIQHEIKSIHQQTKVLGEESVFQGAITAGRQNKPGQIIKLAPRTIMVASIDFGTTYSGWAYSFYADFKSDNTKMYARKWNSGSIETPKTPTCLLVKPDGKTIEAFGYEAENRYKELIEDDEHANYYYFRHFKMVLHRKLSEKMNRGITVEDEMGRSLPAIDVFSMSIRFLKDDVLATCNKGITGGAIETNEVIWVLTVPAIWNDGAKQFMRESAIKAGIESRRLKIALEPESASIYCRHQKIEASSSSSKMDKGISCLGEGKRYMILDAGGGTVDITIHEADGQDKVQEVHAACGGDWGGTAVDKAFESVLVDLVGANIFQRFKHENIEDYLEFWRDFEIKKKNISPSSDRNIVITIPLSLINIFNVESKSKLCEAITKSKYADDVHLTQNKMKISAKLMRSFFKNSINNVLMFCEKILTDTSITVILMVGGYSESPMLQDAVKKHFPAIEVVVPPEPSYIIIKGALIFGHIPSIISKRVLKFTYGIRSSVKFVEGKHPESKRQQTDAGDKCIDIFDKHVDKDQQVTVGEIQVRKSYVPLYKTHIHFVLSVYASEKANPEFTDQDCNFVGKMIVELSKDNTDNEKEIEVALSFSDTEIVVAAKELKTGRETQAAIDFLG